MSKPSASAQNFTLFGIILAAAICWLTITPSDVNIKAWHLFIIFIATIFGIIANPLPMGAVSILGILACVLTGTLGVKQCLSAFGEDIVWLVIFAFFISIGFVKTGLGSRIAYYFISKIGKSTLGLSYGLVLADFCLSPLIPSVTARGGAILFPIANALCKSYSDDDKVTQSDMNKNGGFIMQVCMQANVITSALFLTAMAANPLIVKLATAHQVEISWSTWAIAALVPGIINLLLMPLVIYILNPPAIKHSENAPAMARKKLKEMGPITWQENIMLLTFVLLIALWIFGEKTLGITATTTAMIGFCVLIVARVITFEDAISDKGAWHTFVWFATLVMMSKYLSELGMMSWIGLKIEGLFHGMPAVQTVIILGLFYYYVHYFFASITAHITVLLPTLLVVFINAGVPPLMAALSLGFLSILSGGLTHFGMGSAPIFYGSGYMKIKRWWFVGFMVGLLNLAVWTVAGATWWKFLGLY